MLYFHLSFLVYFTQLCPLHSELCYATSSLPAVPVASHSIPNYHTTFILCLLSHTSSFILPSNLTLRHSIFCPQQHALLSVYWLHKIVTWRSRNVVLLSCHELLTESDVRFLCCVFIDSVEISPTDGLAVGADLIHFSPHSLQTCYIMFM